MTSPGDSGFRLDERDVQASALRTQVLERCRRTLNHDINNAVQSIHSGLELLGKCIASPGVVRVSPQEVLSLLQQQFVVLRQTLDRLVKELAEPPGAPETFDISAVTSEAVRLLRHEHAAAKAKTAIEAGVTVHARKVNMHTLVLALLLDAIDHLSPDGNLEVDVSQREHQARIEIRATRSSADAGQTSRRALVQIVKRLLAAEGAELNVRPAGQGVSSSIYLPSSPERSGARGPASGAVRVLIADRNRDAADSLAMILQFEGMQAQALCDGTHLAETLAGFSPDVALIDVDLPGCDVGAVARSAREQGAGRPLLVQVSSSERIKHEGFDAHLVRPVEWPQLQALIARLKDSV